MPHGSPTGIELEDEDGIARPASTDQLVAAPPPFC
jgi:hypothetical protein